MARRRHRGHRRQREEEGAEQEISPAGPASRPHFFKIILPHTLETGKLGIPKSFLRRYGEDLSGVVLLKVAGGPTWPVKLEKSNNDVVWLWKGWQKFMEHYSIGHGDFLVFKYEGDSSFRVIIFDKSATEIDYPLIEKDMSSPAGEFLSREEENIVEIEVSEGFVPSSRPSSNGLSQEVGGPSSLAANELASEFKSDHPFFKVVIQPSYVEKYMAVPHGFFRKHVQKNKQVATLRYSDRSWQVKLRSHEHRGTAFLSTGWSSFARETCLCVRDICVFELIDRDNNVFRVSIFDSDGRIEIKQSQCQESSSKPALHGSPCPSPITIDEKANRFELNHPYFKMVMQPSYVGRYLGIPCEFFRKYLRKNKQVATLRNSDRSWQVKLRSYKCRGMAYLSTGWSTFMRETGLSVRDVCMFELIDRDEIVFRVSILTSDESSCHFRTKAQSSFTLLADIINDE